MKCNPLPGYTATKLTTGECTGAWSILRLLGSRSGFVRISQFLTETSDGDVNELYVVTFLALFGLQRVRKSSTYAHATKAYLI